jgi:hypothetical protein
VYFALASVGTTIDFSADWDESEATSNAADNTIRHIKVSPVSDAAYINP